MSVDAFCATIYESIQVFAPETWQHFYFNPTLSPFKVPFVLSAFLMGFWLFIVVLLAVLDDLFRQLSPAAAVFYLLGLAPAASSVISSLSLLHLSTSDTCFWLLLYGYSSKGFVFRCWLHAIVAADAGRN